MNKFASTTVIASILAFGLHGAGLAQGTSGGQAGGVAGNASGGVLAQSGAPQSGMGQSGMNQPGMNQPGMNQPGMNQPGMGQPGAGQSGAGQQAGRMGEEQIRSALRTRGYSDIGGLERDGDTFRVSEAKRYGKEVENLRVDARTGQVRDEPRLNEDQARNLIRANGYRDVSDVERDGDTIRAKAKQGDREVRLRVDARHATVTQQQASN